MITIRLNEQECMFEKGHSLKEILENEGYDSPHFAVAVNKQFIPRTEYRNIFPKDGDTVEIVSPMQGG